MPSRNHTNQSSQLNLQKKPYKVNLSAHMADCEANYARLLKLMPTFDDCNQWRYHVQAGKQTWQIQLKVVERARYTTMLEISQQLGSSDSQPVNQQAGEQGEKPHDGVLPWAGSPQLQVRMYHDARMAEVIACQGHRQLKPRYDYPNQQMYQQNEKAQFNRFLGDWLCHSLAHGHSCTTVAVPPALHSSSRQTSR